MESNKLTRILRRHWILIASLGVLGIAGGGIAALFTPVQYSAATRLFVAVQIEPGGTSSDLVQGNNFAIQKVLAYVQVATSPRVLDPVITELGINEKAADLAERVTATVEPNSVIIEINALAPTPASSTELSRAVADSFANVVVNELETPADGSASPVKVEVLQPAVPSEYPALPLLPLNLGLGLVIGLAVGFLVAVAIALLDRRVHGRLDVEKLSEVPIIGTITTSAAAKKRPLAVLDDPRGAHAEAFRSLRTNLEFVSGGLSRSLVVTSSVPGEGKTATVANLGVALAEGGASVVLVDADLRFPRLGALMGIEASVGLSDVIAGRARLEGVLHRHSPTSGLCVLPAGTVPPNPSELLSSKAVPAILASLTEEFDYVLIDTPPVLPVADAAVLSRLTDGALLVVASNRVKESEVVAALEALSNVGTEPVGIVLTMLPARGPDAIPFRSYGAYPLKEAKANSETQAGPTSADGIAALSGAGEPDGQRETDGALRLESETVPRAHGANRPTR
ncbi:MAG: Capsular exopolysaccharide family [Cryobacterium sp.]|nr:Capsular exopolysaccharide family [Cryobacterium sp.]